MRFDSIASSYLYQKEDSLAEQETGLLRDQMEATNKLLQVCNRRITGIAEKVAECGFSNSIPCGKVFKQLPPSHSQGPADISLQEVAQGRLVYEWAEHKMRQYASV